MTYMYNGTGVHENISTYLKCGHFVHWYTMGKFTEFTAIDSNLNKYMKPFNITLFTPFTVDDSFI